jgi:hypothetical protein
MAETITGEIKYNRLVWDIAARAYCWGWFRLSAWLFGHFTYWRFPAGYGKWERLSKGYTLRWVEAGDE